MSEVIVLASGSPRRRQLLEMIGLEFRVVPPEVDESLGPAEQAEGYVTRLAREKARSEEHTSELQSRSDLVCRLLLEKKKIIRTNGVSSPSKIVSPSLQEPPRRLR